MATARGHWPRGKRRNAAVSVPGWPTLEKFLAAVEEDEEQEED